MSGSTSARGEPSRPPRDGTAPARRGGPARTVRPLPIAVDTMGGDHAPEEVIAGAVDAVREHDVRLVLVGQAPRIRHELDRYGITGQIPIVHADEALDMGEGALASWRKPRSSIAIACHLIKQGRASALVSAGGTAGVVATSRLRLKGQQGVMRPAIAVTLPTRPTPTILLDAGATADVKPEGLVQFAALGTAYAQVLLGIDRPRVGLLTIGEEPGKGNKLAKRAHELLASGNHGIEFAGNVEGHDLLRGGVDVIVTDGFTGNIALKTMEGTIRTAFAEIREAMTSTATARMGALLQRRRMQGLRDRLDPDTYGGGVLLGLNGTVVIAHGASRARAITSACELADRLATGRIVERIREQVSLTRTHRFGRWTHGTGDERNADRPGEPVPEPGDGSDGVTGGVVPDPPPRPAEETGPDGLEPPGGKP
ncbi:phosphate acyltransferase PlsX [Actinomadura algeriensis]|uniref:Phosphate acyltransferase n=1 Tax=Actinomadura algeriensis TaxID=1679523 RepID=A0ABR9JLJ5_9ACTN|nr:phosphate acyltransferase PlsX [Actinomadura algeriensis]MBE1531429.1 glycerol-3-phosphate acyltransferase PlsX [Actinomadura algeriensis]